MLLGMRTAWAYTKKYWYVGLILVVGIVWAVMKLGSKKDKLKLLDLLKKQKEFQQQELELIEQVREKERKDKQRAVEKFDKTIEDIEKNHAEAKEKLTNKKRKELKRIIKDNLDDNDKLTKEIADSMGFDVVVVED